jgi:polysaccharide export outer membrane protein
MPRTLSAFTRILVALSLSLFLFSCANQRDFIYFQHLENDSSQVQTAASSAPLLVPGDMISITVAAVDPDVVKPFNLVGSASKGGTETPAAPTYLIDENGFIDFPVLGMMKLSGLSSADAIKLLKDKLKTYVTNPLLTLKILNHKVTVLGEVKNPGVIPIPNEKLTLTEALALAGDLQISGVRKNVLVVREVNGLKVETRVDLTSRHLFSSPVYHLKNNDLIYVEPNKAKIQSTKGTLQYVSLGIGSLGVILNIVNILAR